MELFLIMVTIVLVISGIVVFSRSVNRRFKEMVEAREDSGKTLENVAIDFDVCHFCGKQMTEKTVLLQKMYRMIDSQVATPMHLQSLYEKIEVRIPCCEECCANNKNEEDRVEGRSMLLAFVVAITVAVLVGWLLSSKWREAPLTVIMMVAVFALVAGMVMYSVVKWIMKPRFKEKVECHVAIAALRKAGWSMNEPTGERL